MTAPLRNLSDDELTWVKDWTRQQSIRQECRRMDRAIRLARTPARLYSVRAHRAGRA